jgi:hypothetical protein
VRRCRAGNCDCEFGCRVFWALAGEDVVGVGVLAGVGFGVLALVGVGVLAGVGLAGVGLAGVGLDCEAGVELGCEAGVGVEVCPRATLQLKVAAASILLEMRVRMIGLRNFIESQK